MVYGDLQIFDIIIFAGIAVFLVFRLKKVLGKRTGFEKAHKQKPEARPKETQDANTKRLWNAYSTHRPARGFASPPPGLAGSSWTV